jgi:hypothetical protein
MTTETAVAALAAEEALGAEAKVARHGGSVAAKVAVLDAEAAVEAWQRWRRRQP